MIAPLIPRLGQIFHAQPTTIGLAVPAYLIPYGLMTLVVGPPLRPGRKTPGDPRLHGHLRGARDPSIKGTKIRLRSRR
jgi:hypothetical protein